VNEHDTLPPGGMGPLDPTDIRTDEPECGHWRHWDQEHGECLGHYDWETCDDCGKKVCFDIDCENGWRWTDGLLSARTQCFRCRDRVLPA
jgi:hypothetical protein